MKKKLVSAILIASMLFTQIGGISAAQPEQTINVEILEAISNEDGYTKEVSRIGEATYLYEDTALYTVCIGLYESGYIDIAYKDKSTPDILFISNEMNETTAVEDIEILKNDIIDGKVAMKSKAIVTEVPQAISSYANDTDANIIGNKLESIYSAPYYDKFLTSKLERNVLAYLYEDMSFSISSTSSLRTLFTVGTTLANVAVSLGISVINAKALFGGLWAVVGGVAKLIKDAETNIYSASVIYRKSVKIGQNYPYTAVKEIKYKPQVCNATQELTLGASTINAHSDFANNSQLLSTGIANHLDSI